MIALDLHKKLSAASGDMSLDIQLNVEKKELITLYGKSGAGKTSTLRMLAGLMTPDKGHIVVNDTTWLDTEKGIKLPPQKRSVGFVFQDYALFPNMTVAENLKFALKKNQSFKIVVDLIEIVELGALQNRKPKTLSGGQKQRVALARALVQKPDLLMLDEPLSALDLEMRVKLQHYILEVHQEFGLTTILISHDISEIMKMSDRVVELDLGKVIQQGKPIDFFSKRQNLSEIQLEGKIIAIDPHEKGFVFIIQSGTNQFKMVFEEKKTDRFKVGDMVKVSSKMINPDIRKI